jgi:hypothetical protein
MYTQQKIEKMLRSMFEPIAPRAAYVQSLKKRLLANRRMKVEVEADHTMEETITLAAVGLGAIATVAAITTVGVRLFHRTSAVRGRPANAQKTPTERPSAIA